MKHYHARLAGMFICAVLLDLPNVAYARDANATPRPKISVAPKTLHTAKYKQDTMLKRSKRHPEATSGNTASGENPSSPAPQPQPTH